mmetsp:Transcript_9631/g.21127  ORF Transcript_9631/g.21127 Transcript_9631/m.21127 type:complete len:90 (+) Transcript_9631:1630-1899(+)
MEFVATLEDAAQGDKAVANALAAEQRWSKATAAVREGRRVAGQPWACGEAPPRPPPGGMQGFEMAELMSQINLQNVISRFQMGNMGGAS